MTGRSIEIPDAVYERVNALCLALPEVTVRVDASRIAERSTAYSYDIRNRSFCLLVATEGRSGQPVPRLVVRVDPDDREVMLSAGRPFLAARDFEDRIGVLLTGRPDWVEVGALITESYRMLAPKKLIAQLDR